MTVTFNNLPQRASLLESLEKLAAGSERFGLLVFNLDQFREINIELGHIAGDQVLQAVVDRVRDIMRAGDELFRVGGDEFALLLAGLGTPQLAEMAATKVVEVVALNEARRSRSDYRLYDTLLRDRGRYKSDMRCELQTALDNNALMLYYQPQIDLKRGVLGGCEALSRWNHGSRGWIAPDSFIPVAESSELIDSLTYWSLNVALREWFNRCEENSYSAPISLNLSARLLHSPEIVDLVARAMNIWGAPAGSLVMEVTESAMMADPNIALRTLTALHEMGVTISIDDFGTGYSSLAYLKKLPVGELKIDKSFVMQMAEDAMDRKIVQSVIDLAHNLELQVVAEGVENEASLDMLESMGCDFAQGYFIAKPMLLTDFPGWLESSRWKPPVASDAVESDLDSDSAPAGVAVCVKPD
jgi:EAL domain-containing protein (putative c-di-GMP-specific phosphodiesterase class I)